MPKPAVLTLLPPGTQPDEKKDILLTSAPLATQNLDDARLAERVECALCATGYGALRAVAVSVSDRVVMLLGQVPSYHLKQIAQVTVLAVPGAHQIHNGLVVVRPG